MSPLFLIPKRMNIIVLICMVSLGPRQQCLNPQRSLQTAPESKPQTPNPCLLPVIKTPTTLSGGEYSDLAGGSDTRTHHKVLFTHPSMLAQLVILDPALSISTPEWIWLSTGIRAVDHCVEALCSLNSKAGPETDKVLTAGLELLVPSLPLIKRIWEDEKARLDSMLGVVESMKGISSGLPMGGSHGIGYQLGPLGVGHGETSCIMLPAALEITHDMATTKSEHGSNKS